MVKCRLFDREKGEGSDLRYVEDIKTSGFSAQGDYGWAAIYPDSGTLIVQINSKKWNLTSDDVAIDYYHNYDKGMTTFRISGNENDFEHTYKSWWSERDDFEVDPIAASCEEENSEEDVFGYIKMLKENKESARSLLGLWARNMSE